MQNGSQKKKVKADVTTSADGTENNKYRRNTKQCQMNLILLGILVPSMYQVQEHTHVHTHTHAVSDGGAAEVAVQG